jgi:hypothetical protein
MNSSSIWSVIYRNVCWNNLITFHMNIVHKLSLFRRETRRCHFDETGLMFSTIGGAQGFGWLIASCITSFHGGCSLRYSENIEKSNYRDYRLFVNHTAIPKVCGRRWRNESVSLPPEGFRQAMRWSVCIKPRSPRAKIKVGKKNDQYYNLVIFPYTCIISRVEEHNTDT